MAYRHITTLIARRQENSDSSRLSGRTESGCRNGCPAHAGRRGPAGTVSSGASPGSRRSRIARPARRASRRRLRSGPGTRPASLRSRRSGTEVDDVRVTLFGPVGFERIGEQKQRRLLPVGLDADLARTVHRQTQRMVVHDGDSHARRLRPNHRIAKRPLRHDADLDRPGHVEVGVRITRSAARRCPCRAGRGCAGRSGRRRRRSPTSGRS